MSIPSHIVSIVEQYKKSGEKYMICPEVIVFDGKRYYGASYHLGQEVVGYLFVRENGEIPKKDEVKEEPLLITIGVSHIARNYRAFLLKAANRKLFLVKMAKRLLMSVKKATENKPDEEFQKSLDRFLEVPNTMLEQQEIARSNIKKMTELVKEGQKSGVLTFELFKELADYQLKIGKALFNQNYIQMQTYGDRKKVIKYLFKNGNVISAILLFLFHLILHPDHVKPSDQQDFDKAKRRFLEGKELEEEKIEFKEAQSLLRNPQ